jgi:DNA-binding response OmpR family regulator
MKTVLLVEDDEQIRELVGEALTAGGYRVLRAEHGERALALLDAEPAPPDLIILDWMMPVMGGQELLLALAADAERAAVPVLVLSACDRALKIVGLPVAVVLTKPVRMRTLVEVVDRLAGMPQRPSPFVTGKYPVVREPGVDGAKTVIIRPVKPTPV